MKPAVSLVVVSKSRPEDLRRLLLSLIHQSLTNYEIIVVSDEPPLINRFLTAPLRYIAFAESNISKARNLGIAEATAPIVAFCDDDALPDPFWLERLVQPFYDYPKIAISAGFIRGRNGLSYQWKGVGFDRVGFDRPLDIEPLSETRVFPPQKNSYIKAVGTNCAFRRKALHEIGGFDEGFHYFLDDADICKRLQDSGCHSAIVPRAEIIHNYRANRGRDGRRVPQSLYNIGASTNHFLRKHAPDALEDNLIKFENDQADRLKRFFHYGLLRPKQTNGLLRDLRRGLYSGAIRHSHTPLQPIKAQRLVPLTTRPLRAHWVSHYDWQFAPDHIPISKHVFATSHAASLTFDDSGQWHFRIGRFGRLERAGSWWRYRSRAKLRQTIQEWLAPRFGDVHE